MSELLAGKRGLVLGVSSKDSVGFHTAEELRGHGAELAVSLRPGRAAFAPELSRLGYLPVELEALQPGSIARAIEQVAGRFGRLDFLVHTLVHAPEGALEQPVTELSAKQPNMRGPGSRNRAHRGSWRCFREERTPPCPTTTSWAW